MSAADHGHVEQRSTGRWHADDRVRFAMPAIAAAMIGMTALDTPWSPQDAALLGASLVGFVLWSLRAGTPVAPLALTTLALILALKRSGQFDTTLFLMSLIAAMGPFWSPTPRDLAISLGIAVAAPVLVTAIDSDDIHLGIWLTGICLPAALSLLFVRQSELVAQLAVSQREHLLRDRDEERRRVARDIHDVVARGLAVMLVQVGSARHVLRHDADEADAALASAEAAGRESLAELRATVAALRDPAVMTVGDPAGKIAGAVLDARGHGLDVWMEVDGDPSRLGRDLGVTLVRVAQEALVNAAKHASDARTVVGLTIANELATLEVRSVGAGQPPAGEGGYGLIGMRERIAAAGGTFVAGPVAGDWIVRCALPLADRGRSTEALVRAD